MRYNRRKDRQPRPGPLNERELALLLALHLGAGYRPPGVHPKGEPFLFVAGEDYSKEWFELYARDLVDWEIHDSNINDTQPVLLAE